jgi:hypothetical protein
MASKLPKGLRPPLGLLPFPLGSDGPFDPGDVGPVGPVPTPMITAVTGSALGLAVGVGSVVAVGTGVAVGAGVRVGALVVVGSGVGATNGPTIGGAVRRGATLGRGVGLGVGFGVGLGVGCGVGFGVGFGVGLGVAVGTTEIVTLPDARLALLLSLAREERTTACVPTGSVPDQRNVTPLPHEPPATRVIALSTPPIRAVTLSARDP